jgi:glucan phosphoethanolaminetransferase (alkaline phosphatase superfamily)
MSDAPTKAPWHLWLIGVFAALFNAIGVFDFVMSHTQGDKYLASTGMTPEQVAHYAQMPGWMTVVWAIGVFGAFGASVLLLMRKRLALTVFVVSLVAFLVSLFYTYVLTQSGAVMGTQMAVTSAVIALLLMLFSVYVWRMGLRGVLR